jgi:hypothetical protein
MVLLATGSGKLPSGVGGWSLYVDRGRRAVWFCMLLLLTVADLTNPLERFDSDRGRQGREEAREGQEGSTEPRVGAKYDSVILKCNI